MIPTNERMRELDSISDSLTLDELAHVVGRHALKGGHSTYGHDLRALALRAMHGACCNLNVVAERWGICRSSARYMIDEGPKKGKK